MRQILRAAEEIVAGEGVDAATTRAIAQRAGVAAPSLYRFFDDRDAILDALLEAMLAELEAIVEEAEGRFTGASVEDFVRLEFELHVAYYERHPSLARLWFGGRVSPAVVEVVRARNQRLARRSRRLLTGAGLVAAQTPQLVFELLVEYGDRTLDIAFRGRSRARREVVETGMKALTAFAEGYSPGGAHLPPGQAVKQDQERSGDG